MNAGTHIPFNRPVVADRAGDYVRDSLTSMHHSGDGEFTRRCHKLLSDQLDGASVLLTTSCTHALEMSALLLDIAEGDEVIVPSFTFVSTANAFALRGAKIVFADIRPDTLNLDETQLPKLVSERTRAIVPVHYAGVGCEMHEICEFAKQHGIDVIEDNAHGLMGTYHGRPLGTFGRLATQSFHETKNISCGEGGALIINDPLLHDRAEILREKGTNRSLFFRGQVDKYSWVDIGSSYLPSDILAALLCANLEEIERIQAERRRIWETYHTALSDWAHTNEIRQPICPPHCGQAWHMYYLLMPSLADRTAFIEHLAKAGIKAVFHYLPLHLSKFGSRYGATDGDYPITERVSDRLVRLPFYESLGTDELEYICESARSFRCQHSSDFVSENT